LKKTEFHKNYLKKRDKLINTGALTEDQIKDTLDMFDLDSTNHKLRIHKINCRRDKRRFSMTVLNTQYRILYSSYDDVNLIIYISNHDEYQRMNKNC